MEQDYSDWQKYSVEFEKIYVFPNKKGMTKSTAKAEAIKIFSCMIQEIEKDAERRRKEEDKSEIMKFLMSLEPQQKRNKLTIREQVSFFDVGVEKLSTTKDYVVVFEYKFDILTRASFPTDIVRAIAQKESPFSINVQSALDMKIKSVS